MASNDLFDYMKKATRELQDEYYRIQKRVSKDPGTAGDNGEENWAELFRRWLPANYHVETKGRIMNTEGECSPQVDVLVLSPSYPKALLKRKEYLEGGVLAAFECKLTLKAEHIRDAISTAAKISTISKPKRKGSPYKEIHNKLKYGLLAHSHVRQSPKSTPIENVNEILNKNTPKHPKDVLDVLCISDLATWSTSKLIFTNEYLNSPLSHRYKDLELWESIIKSGGVIEISHICFWENGQQTKEKEQLFTPIGSFLAKTFEMLAWEDSDLRSLAEYFILTNLHGAGQGKPKVWTFDCLSENLVKKLKKGGQLVDGKRWNEWSNHFS